MYVSRTLDGVKLPLANDSAAETGVSERTTRQIRDLLGGESNGRRFACNHDLLSTITQSRLSEPFVSSRADPHVFCFYILLLFKPHYRSRRITLQKSF